MSVNLITLMHFNKSQKEIEEFINTLKNNGFNSYKIKDPDNLFVQYGLYWNNLDSFEYEEFEDFYVMIDLKPIGLLIIYSNLILISTSIKYAGFLNNQKKRTQILDLTENIANFFKLKYIIFTSSMAKKSTWYLVSDNKELDSSTLFLTPITKNELYQPKFPYLEHHDFLYRIKEKNELRMKVIFN